MVTKKVISVVLEKCLSRARIAEKLSEYSFGERLDMLVAEDKMTELDEGLYLHQIHKYDSEVEDAEDRLYDVYEDLYDDDFDSFEEFLEGMPKHYRKEYEKELNEIQKKYDEILFDYDKRLYTNYEKSKGDNPVPSFDWDDYQYDENGIEKYDLDNQEDFIDLYQLKKNASRESIGDVENIQLEVQSNVDFTKKEKEWLIHYFEDGRLSSFLTYMMYGREPKEYTGAETIYYSNEYGDYEEVVEYSLTERWKENFRNIKYHLDNVIDKTSGLDKPTILYHTGRVDPSLLPGDKGVWKGYKSTSFQEQVMDKHSALNEDYWNIIILAPSGTKGVCANDMRFNGFSYVDEHEFLLGRNTGYTVVDIDYETETQIVMLDG